MPLNIARPFPVLLALVVAACGPEPDDDDWRLNDLPGERRTMASCPNGGNTTPTPPVFNSSIDGYASYVGQSKCDPTAKPGVVAFKNLVLATYPCTASYGITRSCSIGGKSEHKEGRAFDWGLNYPHPAATAFLGWLLATDKHGNKHAMARRFGIMYMIWNKKIWKSYQASKGWQAYTGSNPHTDHVHFSFSWDGANKKTSYWNPPPQPAPNKAPTGWLDKADCSTIAGWAQDPDSKSTAIKVQLKVDGTQYKVVSADDHRADLCTAIGSCAHGFSVTTPAVYKDGANHTVRAFGIDLASGNKTELSGSPKTLSCKPPAPGPDPDPNPAPQPDSYVPSPDSGPPSGTTSDGGSWLPDDDELPRTTQQPGRQPAGLVGSCAVAGEGSASPALVLPLVLLALFLRLGRARAGSP